MRFLAATPGTWFSCTRMRAAKLRALLAWLFQTLASLSWVVSVVVYDSYNPGDVLQLTAALCWSLSNVVALPDLVYSVRSGASTSPETVKRRGADSPV